MRIPRPRNHALQAGPRRIRRSRVVTLLCLVGGLVLAHGVSAESPESEAGELPPCPELAAAVPDGWSMVQAPQDDIAFALPSEFHRDTGKPFFIHSGERWVRKGFEVKITYGKWGLSSFKPELADDVCRAEINGVPAVVFSRSKQSRRELTAWIRVAGEAYEPVLGIKFAQPTDEPLARQILGSLHWANGK